MFTTGKPILSELSDLCEILEISLSEREKMIAVFDEVFSRNSLLDELYRLLVYDGEIHNFGGFLSSTLEVIHHNIRQWKGGHNSPNVPRLDE
ncbi:MAG: hypothetical protein VX725_04780, partial [Actinomycetota bacterium]|nr:hypothetical protein [Actinomycetota bacterium]